MGFGASGKANNENTFPWHATGNMRWTSGGSDGRRLMPLLIFDKSTTSITSGTDGYDLEVSPK